MKPRGTGLEVVFGEQAPLRSEALSATRFAAAGVDTEFEVRGGRLVFRQADEELECLRE